MSAPIVVPPIQVEFISDALASLDHPVPARDIAEIWCDQKMHGQPTPEEFEAAVKQVTVQVKYYMPF
jgi:hypothetical protein